MDNRKNPNAVLLLTLIGIALIFLPYYAGVYTVTTFIRIIYFSFLACSVGMLIGQGGMISLVQTTFFGFTAYTVGLLGYEHAAIPFPYVLILAVFLLVVFALILGLLVMRTYRIVFLMLTLALAQIGWAFARQNTTLLHGWHGIRGIEAPVIFGIDFGHPLYFYWGSLAIFAVGLYVLWRIIKSPFGLSLNGVRESPRRMAALGYRVYWIRVVAFVIAAVYAGIGGLLAVYFNGNITPTTIQLSRTIWIILVVVLGGAYYFWGPVVGVFIGTWLEVLISPVTPRYSTIIGIVFVATVLLAQGGILGVLDTTRLGEKLKQLFSFNVWGWFMKAFQKGGGGE